jgi:formylglycine-generating enzyme required for sulfatase activity
MTNTSSAFGLALATTVLLASTCAGPEAFAGEPEAVTARLEQTAETGSAPNIMTPNTMTAGQVFTDCSDGCPQMVVIPAGRYLMGSELYAREQPQHPVNFTTTIAVGVFETTFDEWDACVRDGGCVHNSAPSDEGWGRGRRPVINVSWNDAKEYVAWLSRKTGKVYRLLTEAEWEYAARAGSTTTYSWGDRITCGNASYDGGRGSDCAAHTGWFSFSLRGTQPVGTYSANRWGLHDMLGNVWEWCEDNWHPDYHGAPTDGSAWSGGDASMRILRGGAWNYAPSGLRSADRNWLPAGGRTSFVGFRVAREEQRPPGNKISGLAGREQAALN